MDGAALLPPTVWGGRARQLSSAPKPAVWPWRSGLTSLSFTFSSWTLWQHWSRQRGWSQTSCLQICFKLLFTFIYLFCAFVHGGSWAQHSVSGEVRGQLQELTFPPTMGALRINPGLGSQCLCLLSHLPCPNRQIICLLFSPQHWANYLTSLALNISLSGKQV